MFILRFELCTGLFLTSRRKAINLGIISNVIMIIFPSRLKLSLSLKLIRSKINYFNYKDEIANGVKSKVVNIREWDFVAEIQNAFSE